MASGPDAGLLNECSTIAQRGDPATVFNFASVQPAAFALLQYSPACALLAHREKSARERFSLARTSSRFATAHREPEKYHAALAAMRFNQ